MALASGKLRHRVELQRLMRDSNGDAIKDTNGDQVIEYATFATVWAEIAPMSAREFVASEKTSSEIRARITIRFRNDVDSTVRIKHRTTIYNIEGVLSDVESGLEYLTLPVTANLAAV